MLPVASMTFTGDDLTAILEAVVFNRRGLADDPNKGDDPASQLLRAKRLKAIERLDRIADRIVRATADTKH